MKGMRLTRRLIIATAILVPAAQAAAQTQLTAYGNLDLGIVKESGTKARMARGYNNWIGFKGEEDIGNGVSAIFNLQTRLDPGNGRLERAAVFWQGESTLGLRSARAGTLRLGKALSPLWQNVWAFEPWLNSGFNASLGAYQTGSYSSDGINDAAIGYANFSRIGSGVFYTSPSFSGLTVDAAASVERTEGAVARVMGASLNYAHSRLRGMFSLERNARKDRIAFLGASYRIGPMTLMGSYARGKLAGLGYERSFVIAGTYKFGANTLRIGFGKNSSADNRKLSAGAVHALSKRTSLYADLYRERTDVGSNGVAAGISHAFY
jgi:predicted porin